MSKKKGCLGGGWGEKREREREEKEDMSVNFKYPNDWHMEDGLNLGFCSLGLYKNQSEN